MFLNRGEDDVIERIEARIAKYTAIPKENGEGLQILHYQVLDTFSSSVTQPHWFSCSILPHAISK